MILKKKKIYSLINDELTKVKTAYNFTFKPFENNNLLVKKFVVKHFSTNKFVAKKVVAKEAIINNYKANKLMIK